MRSVAHDWRLIAANSNQVNRKVTFFMVRAIGPALPAPIHDDHRHSIGCVAEFVLQGDFEDQLGRILFLFGPSLFLTVRYRANEVHLQGWMDPGRGEALSVGIPVLRFGSR